MVEMLTETEHKKLLLLEARIDQGLKGTADAVDALLEIHRLRLYRQTHRTFTAYCEDRWPRYSSNYIYRLLNLAKVRQNVSDDGDDCDTEEKTAEEKRFPLGNRQLPNERQARVLKPLPPQEQKRIWEEVTAERERPTAFRLEEVVNRDRDQAKVLAGEQKYEQRSQEREEAARWENWQYRLGKLRDPLSALQGKQVYQAGVEILECFLGRLQKDHDTEKASLVIEDALRVLRELVV